MTFTAITPTSMTVNWIDNSTDETAFLVYRSSDNVNFTLVATVASTSSWAHLREACALRQRREPRGR
jgi:hypothetical protein